MHINTKYKQITISVNWFLSYSGAYENMQVHMNQLYVHISDVYHENFSYHISRLLIFTI